MRWNNVLQQLNRRSWDDDLDEDSSGGKLQRSIRAFQNILRGARGQPMDQPEQGGMQREPALPRVYPSGRVGGVLQGLDRSTDFINKILAGFRRE